MRLPCIRRLALLALPLLATSGCKDDESPTAPTADAGAASATSGSGAAQVRGTERLGWNQIGDVSKLRFRAYVDNRPVDLTGATCSSSGEQAECYAPLPALSDGVHTIALVNIAVSTGVESERSAPITLQKVSASARLDQVITIAGDLSFAADIVATDVRAPAQLAWLPDGRLLLSDADGRVRIVRPGASENGETALDAGMLTSLAAGPMGLASHPDFAQNRFVYVSLLEQERPERTRLRVVRLREVGDTLGEAATLFDAPVVDDGTASQAGPRMAFGPDRLLYVMLPPGLEFVNEPAASTPRASLLRLTDDGRATPGEPLSGVASTPLAFTWHPATGALWVMFRGENGEAAVRSLGGRVPASAEASAGRQTMRAEAPRLLAREGIGAAAGTLLLQPAPDDLLVAQALLGTRADGSRGLARLALPLQSATGGMSDRIGDVVAGDGGMLFAVTNNGHVDGVAGAASDVVLRLRPLPASSGR